MKYLAFLFYFFILLLPGFSHAYIIQSSPVVTGNSLTQTEAGYTWPDYSSGWFLYIQGLNFKDLQDGLLYYLPTEEQSCDLGAGGFNVNDIYTGELIIQYIQGLSKDANGVCYASPVDMTLDERVYTSDYILTTNSPYIDYSLQGTGIVYFQNDSNYFETGTPYHTLTSSSTDSYIMPDYQLSNYLNIIQPANNATTSSTTVTIIVEYNADGLYSMDLTLQRRGIGYQNETYSTSTEFLEFGSGLSKQWTFTLPATSTWDVFVRRDKDFTEETETDNIIFSVLQEDPALLATRETWEDMPCSISDLTGCFKKALYWAFVPSSDIFDPFGGIWDDIKRKPPIGYAYVAFEQVQNVGASSTGAFTIEEIPALKENIFDPIKTGFTWLLVIAFLFGFYQRLKHIQV